MKIKANPFKINKQSIAEFIIAILLLFIVFAPSTFLFNLIIVTLTTLLFIIFGNTKINQNSLIITKITLFALIVIGALVHLSELTQVDLTRSIVLLIMILFSPIKVRPGKLIMRLVPILIITLFITQILIAIGEPLMISLRDQYYPIEKNAWMTSEDLKLTDILSLKISQRFGGLYYNPNIMGQMITFVSCLSLYFWKSYSKFLRALIITATFIAILITGSRTALAAAIPIFLFGTGAVKLLARNAVVVGLMVIFAITIVMMVEPKIPNLRAAEFSSGIFEEEASLFIKANIFNNYLNDHLYSVDDKTIELAFGYAYPTTHMDFDIGYIINIYGFVGLLLIALYIYILFNKTPRRNRYIYFLLLISIGATVFINFRFSILFFLIAGTHIYNYENTLVRASFR